MKKNGRKLLCLLLVALTLLIAVVPSYALAGEGQETERITEVCEEQPSLLQRLWNWIEEVWGRIFAKKASDPLEEPAVTKTPSPPAKKQTSTERGAEAKPPKVEEPKSEAFETEAPKTEAPKNEETTPKWFQIFSPKPEASETEAPVPESPATEPKEPVTEAPAVSGKLSARAEVQRVLALVNEERARAGLSPVTVDEELCRVAQVKSEDMKSEGYFSHTSPRYGSPFDMMKQFGISYRTAGENIAMGYATPETVMEGWMNSEGHRANILKSDFTKIGIGYCAEGNYWVQMFVG